MRNILLYLISSSLLVATGCKKFLEQPPDNRAVLDDPEKISQLLATAYPQANYMAFCESISDNVADKGIGGIDRTNFDPFFFQDVNDDDEDSPEFYWNGCYTAIAAANQALDAIENTPDATAYNAQKGEALVARAYAHFMLVTFFSKVYDSTAADNPGIPYVTKPEKIVFENYERKTVKYVYEQIEKDLTEGLALLDDKAFKIPRYHFTKAATHAFACRFYLFKKDYDKVIEHADAVFPNANVVSQLRPWNTEYYIQTYNELWARYAKATEPANLLLVETQSLWGRQYFSLRFGMESQLADLIIGPNVTGGTWIFNYQLYTIGTNNYMLPKVNEHFVRASVNAEIGQPYVMVPLFTTEEVLFNRAEAYNEKQRVTEALTDINTYASTRIFNYNPNTHLVTATKARSWYGTTDTKKAVLEVILDFKRAEFAQEGMRWFDLLRHKRSVTHREVYGWRSTLGPDDPRRVFQIPDKARMAGIDQNPR